MLLTNNYKDMNTGNIKSCQITLLMDDDTAAIGTTDDVVVLNVIASFVKFVKIDREKVTQIKLKDII